ncbi:hypothetical protein UFOVP1522_21 [uncultured Caudovirales phage]|uniref:Uncharacterized protein n=1 Tax=uncultured Caudovirales phage TaxID=2100421 RepID=A0A6J7X947_9CAUD|nr:hypothetical protein UFOVP989_2 [uncultured Caudovirales phage]CAB4181749.1 hypothetical protein UFOVP1075_64 [uncultured Caudovirales phage]CAB4198765.1 hypothetical protein UFOVP1312_56 [uncultured Caudovirales phage]CAB4210329.1 hypothetical protein UFOVP1426_2 [uncultured Caudovirales phage]CAB5227274.1 hypothetical protein UFOVP1522_21 [uncultured Caudovirales phage]
MNKHLFARLLTIFLFLISGLIVLSIFFYYYPRNIVEAPQSQTNKTEYRIGDPILVSGSTKVYVNADSDNTVYIRCGISSYVVQSFKLRMYKTEGDYPAFKLGIVPDGVNASPPNCQSVTESTYNVHTFLWFKKEYTHTFYTNEFKIIK